MMTQDAFFKERILPIITSIKVILNGEYEEQILDLDGVIDEIFKIHNFLEGKYKIFQKFKNDIIKSKSGQSEILENIKNANNFSIYAVVPQELQELLGDYISSKKQLEEIESELDSLIKNNLNFIEQAKFIQTIIYRFKDNIFRIEHKNTSYSNFKELNKYISIQSRQIRFQSQLTDEKLFTSQQEQIKLSFNEISQIQTKLNKVLSLEQICNTFKKHIDIVEYLIDIFDITTIPKITVNDKCQLLININNQDYVIENIISECKKIEKKATYILDKAQMLITLIQSYYNEKDFIKTYSSKKGCSSTNLVKIVNNYFYSINYTLVLICPSILDDSIKNIENDADYTYFRFIHEKIIIFIENYQKNCTFYLDLNKFKALIEICGASFNGIGLDSSGEYAFYYNYGKSKFTTFKKFMSRLCNVQNKLEKCLSQTELLLATGKQCFECSGFFNVLRQSYLKQSEDINIYTDKYCDKLEQAKLDSETNILELESKQSIIESIDNELEVMQKYAKFLNDTVYKTDTQHNYTLFTENYIQPAENISELYQNVDEIILSNNGDGKIRLFFVSNNNKKSYFTTRHEYSCLNQSLKRLQEKAKCISRNNKYLVRKKEEQKSITESHHLKNKFYELLYCFGFAVLVSTFLMGCIFILKGINLLYENINMNQTEEMVSNLEIPGEK